MNSTRINESTANVKVNQTVNYSESGQPDFRTYLEQHARSASASTAPAARNPFHELLNDGYTRLVPVVPVDAELSPASRLQPSSRGNAPGVRGPDGLWCDLPDCEPTEADYDKWAADGAGVGLRTGDGLIAIDINILDEGLAKKCGTAATQILGSSENCTGRPPARSKLYRVDGRVAYRKLTFKGGTVELLADGRQLVVHGLHPVSGLMRGWPRGRPRFADLPIVSAKQISDYFDTLGTFLPAARIEAASLPAEPAPAPAPAPAVAANRSELDSAVDFLVGIAGGGLIALAAIVPDTAPFGRTFDTTTERADMLAWLRAHNGSANLYYSLNAPKPAGEQIGQAGKLKEEDVAYIRGIAVDIDPKGNGGPGDDGYEREREKLLGIANTWAGHVIAPATTTIDSGNGVQLVWLFPTPLPATTENSAAVKAQARGFNKLFGGDPVHSLDHLIRIPGTENLPGKLKREKGRKRCTGRLLSFDPKATCRLEDLAVVAPPVAEQPAAAVDLDDFDYHEVVAAAEGESLPTHLAPVADAIRSSKAFATAMEKTDKSGRDFAVVQLARERGLSDPTEIAIVAFSLSPERLLQDEERGRGEYYAKLTVRNAMARQKPTAADFFTGSPAALDAPSVAPAPSPARLELRVITGVVDAQRLPVRNWLIRPRLPIGDVTQCVGEPAIGKSTFAIRDALVVATGREDLLRGKDAAGSPISAERLYRRGVAVIYNAEDRLLEMEKRLAAVQRHFGIAADDMKHPIILWSGVDMPELKIMAREGDRGPLKRAPGADMLEQVIRQHGAVFVCLDPQISLAVGAVENSSEDQNTLLQEIASIAARHKVNITVVHHTAKGTRDDAGDMGAGRGAFSAVAKVRSAYTLTNVLGTRRDEKEWGVTDDDRLIRLDISKISNDNKPARPTVFKRSSVAVGNGTGRLPQGVNDLFEASPQARLEAEGDFAAVVEVVDIKARAAAAKTGADSEQQRAAEEIAAMACELMGDDDAVKLADLRDALGARMREARLCKAVGRTAINERIMDALLGGCEITRDGQVIRMSVERAGAHEKAVWYVKRTGADIQRNTQHATSPAVSAAMSAGVSQ